MEKLRNTAAIVFGLVAISASATSNALTVPSDAAPDSVTGVESTNNTWSTRGVARRGDQVYSHLFGAWPREITADQIVFVVTYPPNKDVRRNRKAGSDSFAGVMSGSFGVPQDPNYPVGPGVIGQTTSTDSCGLITSDGSFEWATIEYHYEYRYTRDSNRDGKMDSDPKWVLVGASWTYFTLDSAQICQ